VNPKFLSVTTLALLVILVAFPLVFILLQAVFPQFSAGVFSGAFSGVATLLAEPQLPTMLGGTLQVAVGVALVSALIYVFVHKRNLMDIARCDFSDRRSLRGKLLIALAVVMLALLFCVSHLHNILTLSA